MTRYGIEERNLARLNPVLGLNRVPADLTGWHRTIALDAIGSIVLSCDSGKDVVPHGIDADIVFALTTAYEVKGRPSDRILILSLAELCNYAGLSRNGVTYDRIQKSINRLTNATFKADQSWLAPKKDILIQTTTTFRIIEGLTEVTRHIEPDKFDPMNHLYNSTTKLKIRLSYEIVASLNSNYSRIIDLEFYSRIKQPLGRMLYRVLEEQRLIAQSDQIQFPILSWGAQLGIVEADRSHMLNGLPAARNLTPFQIRRALEPAHKNLIEENYISEITYVGRGSEQTIVYSLKSKSCIEEIEPDSALVGLLESRGVSLIRAQQLSKQYSKSEIESATKKYDQRIREGYKPRSKGGFMCDLLTHSSKYTSVYEDKSATLLNPTARPKTEEEVLEEHASPSRTRQAVEKLLLKALEQTSSDRELREQLISQYLENRHSVFDFVEISQLSDADARVRAVELLAR